MKRIKMFTVKDANDTKEFYKVRIRQSFLRAYNQDLRKPLPTLSERRPSHDLSPERD